MITAGTKRAIDVAETRLQIRQDTQTCLCTSDEVAECGLIICGSHPNRGIVPLPSRSDVSFWNKAQDLGVIDPLVEIWNDLGQPPVLKLAVIWNDFIDFVAEITRLGFNAEAIQANA